MELLALALAVIVIGVLGVVIGLRLAPRLDRWVARDGKQEGDDE